MITEISVFKVFKNNNSKTLISLSQFIMETFYHLYLKLYQKKLKALLKIVKTIFFLQLEAIILLDQPQFQEC